MRHRMRRRDLVRGMLALVATPALLALGSSNAAAQAEDDAPASDAPAPEAPSTEAPPAPVRVVAPRPVPAAPPSARNNIVGLNVGRLHQRLYIWAAADLANAQGGDWGYVTSVWTIEDREARTAELDLQIFLDFCYEYEIQPIVRVATRFDPKASSAGVEAVTGAWVRPEWDEPVKWRTYFEQARWPTERVWIVAGNEPNLGREWGGAVDAAGYARYLARFLDVFADSPRFKVVNGPLDISNGTDLPNMQDAMEFLDAMGAAVPSIFERLPAWASNPYRVPSGGTRVRYTHLGYEAELDRIGREMPVLITEAGHLETGDDQEIANFYADAYRDWLVDPKVIAATPLFWHPDRNDHWMFELDRKGAFVHRSPTYELLRKIPKVAGTPYYQPPLVNVARTMPFETVVEAETPPAPPSPSSAADQPLAGAPPANDPELDGPEPSLAARALGPAPAPAERTVPTRPTSTSPALRVANTGGQGARLRAGPSPEADLIGILEDGTLVQPIGPGIERGEQRWRLVRLEDGSQGWIAGDLLAPASE